MKQKSKKIDMPKGLSNNEEITEKDILTLSVLMKQGRIANPKLLKELNLRGADLKAHESAGYCRRKLEKMGVIESYPAKINWKNVGYPTEFVVFATTDNRDAILEIERRHIADVKEYREQTGADMLVISLNGKGDKVILKDIVLCGGEKPIAIITGIATDEGAAMMFGDFYLPKRYPDMDTNLVIVHHSSIRDFEFQDRFIESITPVLFGGEDIKDYRDTSKKEFI